MVDYRPPQTGYRLIPNWTDFRPGAVILIREKKEQMLVERPAIVIKSFPSKIDILKFTTTPNRKFDFFQFRWNDKLQNCRLIYADTIKFADLQAQTLVPTDWQLPPLVRRKIFGYLRLYQLCVEQNLSFNKIRLNYEQIMDFIKKCEREQQHMMEKVISKTR